MTSTFSSKKASKISKRKLGMESLENREMLSVNPLGIDAPDAPDFVQTAAAAPVEANVDAPVVAATSADFSTEATSLIADVTGSGLTTNSITLNLPKVTGAKSYTVVINDGSSDVAANVTDYGIAGKAFTTKTAIALSGLKANQAYTVTFTAYSDNAGSTAISSATSISAGTFTTLNNGGAAAVIVGPVTGINAAFQAAKTGTTNGIKVTWKAPANYTGSYTVTVDDGTNSNTLTKTVAAGAKTEALLTATDTGAGSLTPANNKYYRVTVVAGTASIAAPSVTIAVGKPTSGAPAAPAATVATTPQSVVSSAGTKVGNVTVTVAPDGTDNAIGYWVGLSKSATGSASYSAFAGDSDTVALTYVAKPASGNAVVTFSGLDTTVAKYYGVAFAVAADGNITNSGTGDTTGIAPLKYTTSEGSAVVAKSYIKNEKLTIAAVSGTPTSTKVSWTADGAEDAKVVNWIVSYSIDGKSWINAGNTAVGTTTFTVTGLNLAGVKYQFSVQADVNSTEDSLTGTGGLAKAVTVTSSKANVAAPAKVANLKVDATLSETQISAKWDAVTGAAGYNVTLSDGKGIVDVYFVTTNAYVFVNTLVPKVKYAVAVEAVYYDAANAKAGKTAAANVSISTVDWAAATVKLASGVKPGLLSAEIEITLGKGMADGKFAVEYTSVVDAKGKPDWNAAAYVPGANAAAAATAFKNVQLAPNTQYFVRAVYFAGTDAETDVTKTVLSKDLKFKTATPPLATVGKAGFGLVNDNFGFKFDFKTPEQNKKANAAEISGTTYTYKLWVASDKAKVDKATGKLEGAIQIEFNSATDAVDLTSATYSLGVEKSKTDSTIVAYALKDAIGFSEITGLETTWKSVQYQLEVIYSSASANPAIYYSNFTKPGKLALPKWYV